MFELGSFKSHSGISLFWKIECDDLTDKDIATLAYVVSESVKFGSVYGVPTGGLRLADALKKYCTEGPRLVVDDVLTTGGSMETVRRQGDIGVVIFARGPCPDWVQPIFQFNQLC